LTVEAQTAKDQEREEVSEIARAILNGVVVVMVTAGGLVTTVTAAATVGGLVTVTVIKVMEAHETEPAPTVEVSAPVVAGKMVPVLDNFHKGVSNET